MVRPWSTEELTELALLRLKGFSLRRACEHFHEIHPDRPKPSTHLVKNAINRLRLWGTVRPLKPTGPRPTVTTEYQTARLEALLAANPSTSVRQVSKELGISYGSVVNILRRNGYEYHSPRATKCDSRKRKPWRKPEQKHRPYTFVLSRTFLGECWSAWHSRQNLVYKNLDEKRRRRVCWIKTLIAMMKHNIQYDMGLKTWRMNLAQVNARLSVGDVIKPDCDEDEQEKQLFVVQEDNSVCVVLEENFVAECWLRWKEKHNKDYADAQEDRIRLAKWTNNMVAIMRHNAKCEIGLNDCPRCLDQFADQVSP